jgi:hypothetical protein
MDVIRKRYLLSRTEVGQLALEGGTAAAPAGGSDTILMNDGKGAVAVERQDVVNFGASAAIAKARGEAPTTPATDSTGLLTDLAANFSACSTPPKTTRVMGERRRRALLSKTEAGERVLKAEAEKAQGNVERQVFSPRKQELLSKSAIGRDVLADAGVIHHQRTEAAARDEGLPKGPRTSATGRAPDHYRRAVTGR